MLCLIQLPAKTAYLFRATDHERRATNKKCETNPICPVFRPKTMITIKNEPNSNPIYAEFAVDMLSWPAVRMLSTYSGQRLRKTVCSSSSLRPKQQTFSQSRKNEPKTNPIYPDSNPICEKNTKIYALSKYNFLQLFTTALRRFMRRWDFSTKRILLFTTFQPKNMPNEPNLKNTKINITAVPTKAYMKNGVFTPTQNEPKTNPISNFPLRFNQFMKNMRNEPNLQNPQINVTLFITKHYENKCPFGHRKNEPNLWKTNPILPALSLPVVSLSNESKGRYGRGEAIEKYR